MKDDRVFTYLACGIVGTVLGGVVASLFVLLPYMAVGAAGSENVTAEMSRDLLKKESDTWMFGRIICGFIIGFLAGAYLTLRKDKEKW